jgi:guanine deaminase
MNESFMQEAIRMAVENVRSGAGGPFACIVVRGDEIVGRGTNLVTTANDPTAHGEIVAIRDACRNLQTFQLIGCDVYTSCEPCPMCLGAIYWARPDRVFFAATQHEAAEAGFDDALIYREIALEPEERQIPMTRLGGELALEPFETWLRFDAKTRY